MNDAPPSRLLRSLSRRLPWLALLATAALFSPGLRGEELGLPAGIVDSQDPRDTPETPAQSLARIKVPAGFRVTLFAGEPQLGQPIAFDFDDRGRLWVVEGYAHPDWQPTGHDRVLIFEDTDSDGTADRRTVFWDQGRYLSGIAVGHGGVFLCNTPELIFLPDNDRNDVPDGPPEPLLDGWIHKNPHNVFNNLCFGPDGWLYGSVGQDQVAKVGVPSAGPDARREISRGIWRYHPGRRQFEVVAQGAVNPWGLDFNEYGDGFFTNCVLPHLWLLLRGAYYERRLGEQDNPYVYERIQPICDHRHWAEGNWTDSRGGHGAHGDAGGGHAHTGAMIYLADQWPARYRGTFFTGNLHGNRINNDRLERIGSGYVGRHNQDFLFGNSPWFRCLSQKVGPAGSAFISDWHDVGECHDNDGSHRSSGRIYRVSYGASTPIEPFDLQQYTPQELVALQKHPNDWFARRGRRVLQERATAGTLPSGEIVDDLNDQLAHASAVTERLRALWTLFAIGQADASRLTGLLNDPSEYVRSWAVRLLVDAGAPGEVAQAALVAAAADEASPYVRLSLAQALPYLADERRSALAGLLASHAEDAADPLLPGMVWYGVEPLVPRQPAQALELLRISRIPRLSRYLSRRLTAEVGQTNPVVDPP